MTHIFSWPSYSKIQAYKTCMYHIVLMYQYRSILSYSPHTLLSRMRTRMYLIHSPCTHGKTHGIHCSPGVCWIGMQNCWWFVSYSLHNIVNNVIPKNIVDKRHGFLVLVDTSISRVQHQTHVVHNYRCRFRDIDPHLYKLLSVNDRFLSSLLRSCELSTKCWGLHRGLEFLCPFYRWWSHHWKQSGDQYPSDLDVSMVRIQKHMNIQFIKERFMKLIINLLTKVCILIYKIILHMNLLILNINVQ